MEQAKEPTRHILNFYFCIGFGSLADNSNVFKRFLYKFYIFSLVSINMYCAATVFQIIMTFSEDKIKKIIEVLLSFAGIFGLSVLYLENFLMPQTLNVIFEKFAEIDEILKVHFNIQIDYKVIKRHCNLVLFLALTLFTINITLILMFTLSQLAIDRLLNQFTIILTVAVFGIICWQIRFRYLKLKECLSNLKRFRKGLSTRKILQISQIFEKTSIIICECNRYFRLKLSYVFCKWNDDTFKRIERNFLLFLVRKFIGILASLFSIVYFVIKSLLVSSNFFFGKVVFIKNVRDYSSHVQKFLWFCLGITSSLSFQIRTTFKKVLNKIIGISVTYEDFWYF